MKKKNFLNYNLQLFAEGVNDDELDQRDAGEKTDDSSDDGEKNEPEKEKTFTQEQVNRMMAKEKNQGRKAILNELGINPNDKGAIEKVKNLINSQKSDEEIAAEEKTAAQQAVLEAEERAALAEAKAEAMMAGIKPQYVEDAVILAMSKIEEDGDLKTLLAEFKTKYPIWFDVDDDGAKAGQKGTGSSINGTEGKAGSKKDGIGARLAAQRKNSNKKSSYWGNK